MAERVDGSGTTRGNRQDDELSRANDFRLSDEDVERHDVVMHEPGHMEPPLDPESATAFPNQEDIPRARQSETADSSQTGLPPLDTTTIGSEEGVPTGSEDVGRSSRSHEEERAQQDSYAPRATVDDETPSAAQPARFVGERGERGQDSPPPAAPAPQAATTSVSDAAPVDTTEPIPTPTNLAATVSLQNLVAGLSETTDTSSSVKVADIVITDDGIGTNTLSLAGADAAKFEIVDTGSGFELHLRAGTVLDHESASAFDITVQVDDPTVGGTPDDSVSQTVNIDDVNDTGQVFVSGNFDNAAENISDAAVVYTASVTDADTTGEAITFSLVDDAGGLFEIDANTGHVTLAGGQSLDFETATSHDITIRSSDGTNSTDHTVTINVTDVNDNAQVFTSGAGATIAEDVNDTSVIYTATTTDVDTTGEAITYSLTDDAGGLFEINSATGEVTLAGGQALDFETATSHDITIRSSDGTNTTDHTVTVNVTNVNESGASAITDINVSVDGVNENSAVGSVVGITALATDSDSADTISYSLSDNAGGLFAIDPNTGVVTVAGALDAEAAQNHSIEVTATSTDGSTSTQTFNITVHDVDEFNISATSDNDGTTNTVAESAVVGSAVGVTALATDVDVTDTVTYSLSSNPGGFFAIDANTGVVTVANALDYETDTSHTIEVTSTSTDGSTSTQTFTINVSDEDEADVGAISDTNATGNAVNENATVGTVVGVTAFASDTDGTDAVAYSLSDDAGGLFAIDANTGVVTVAGPIDRETAASYDIEVTATSDDGSTSTQTFTISVNDLDEFDVSTPTDTNAGANTVSETAANGTAVGITAAASDGDATNSAVTYSIVDGSGDPVVGGPFTVDPNTGVVTIADNTQLDYETATSHTINVKATSVDGSEATQSFTVSLTDTDEADVGAISDTNGAGNAVNENATVGTVVGVTAFASDTDGTDTVSYSLSDNAGGLFAIDANTGVVTVAGAIDRETAASYNIEVTATSTDGSTSAQTFTISVNDLDEFDVSTPTDSDGTANSVAENAANGTAVGITAAAADGDATNSTVTYSLVDGSGDPVVGGPFTVDANTGVVTVADNSQLDYETATSHTIHVKATSADGSDATQSFTVNLTDVNEAGVGTISDTNMDANGVAENSAVGTVVGVTALASDPDSGDTVTYALSDNAGGLFAIDANTGVVTVAGALDAESAQNHSIEVTATSTDGSTSTQTFNIAVNDVDEFNISATTDNDGTANSVSEAATVGTAVGITALASDADVTDTVTYSLSSNPGGFFAIDANTGVVTVANGLDYETATSHTIEVTSTSDDGSTSTQTFTVNVTDADEADVGAISDTNASGNAVDENASVGTVVGVTAFASDTDGTDTVSYSLSDDAGGLFAIDANTGVVTVAGAIDRETAASYDIEVTATSTDGSTSTQTFTVGVNDLNEFDVSTPTDSNAAANGVAENAANGTAVGITASAADGDATNSAVTYSLVDGSGDPVVGGPFVVDPNTGVVTVADNSQLDYETATSHTIYVKATSADGSDATQSFTINLTDADEGAVGAISDSNVAGNAVNEDASVGTVVGITALASDPDGSDTVTYSLSDNAGGLFTIDANTGVVTVAAGLDAETAQNHTIEVTATSTDGSTSTQTFNIGVNDVDEFDISATSDNDGTANAVSEAATVGTAVGVTALATDADVTDTVTYSLSSNPGGFFAIDANTGVVTVANALDYEADTAHTIEVTSTSDDGTTSTQTFTINVSDADESDVSAISDTNASANAVDENSSVGTVVGVTAFASDADGTDSVTYSLSDDAGGLFAIDANTGVVTVAGAIDREAAASYDIEVTATSDDGSTSTQTYSIGVNDLDEFDVSTPTDANAAANSVSESAANGTAVGITASAADGDATNSSVTYSLVDGSGDPVVGGAFAVDANTGVVTVADNSQLDHETATSHTIYVKATSADGSDATQSFTVNLTDADEADVGAISDTNASGNAVNEDASIGTVVGITALAADPDSTDTVTYSLSDNAGGLFAIDANTGVVTVAAGLDAETTQNHSIEVTATSTDGSTSTQTFNIGVNDVDEFNISATSDNDGSANSVSESAAVGTAVGVTALATDADVTDTVSYSLSSNPGGFFAIDANTGVVTVANALDYETDTSHVIEVTSTSDDGSTSTQTFTINVSDEDEADVGAISDTNAAGNAVDENSSVGTVVGVTAFATDADGTDSVTYSLSDDAGGLFAIDANTGVVTVAGAIDRETAASYDIEVTATSDDGSTSAQTFTVNVNDLDEFDVSTPTDANATANSVSESAANGTAVGITASASDGDATNNSVTYTLVDGSGDPVVGGPFTVDANTGVVTVADNSQLDYESATSHTIYVKATSADGSDATQSFTVNLTDADEADVGAISDTNATGNAVDENSSVGTVVGITAQASDADGTDTVTYSLSNNAGGLFAIDANTGVVTVAGAIDAETAQNHSIEVTATSTDGSTSTQTFNIAVNDVDEFNVSATSDNDGTANSVSEAATVGTAVGVTALASDADVTDTVSYSLSSNPGGFFAIDANTGVVTVAGSLDYETDTPHTIEVTSTSLDGSTSTQTFTINVTDFDEADVSAISDTNASANAVDENVAVGTTVGITASATDADGSDDVTYNLSDDAGGLFAIDANTGVVTVAGAIDRETAASYNIEVTATSDDGSTSTQTYTINVNDIDEFDVSTPTDSNASANTVSETAANGTVVGVTASASDGDATNNGVTYSIVDGSGDPVVGGPFTVDTNTGIVTVADNTQLDYESATSHTVYIKATSADGSDATQSFTVAVSNEMDEAPTDITFTGGTVNETVTSGGTIDSAYDPSGATVATLSTTDADSGDSFSYAITNDTSGKFEIVGNEVRVKAGQTIDYETDTSFDITVEVTDGGGNTYSEVITINVQDYEGSHTSGTLHEGITGTSEEDTLTGDAGQNIMVGGDGDDTMYGGDGHDIIEGGAGADTLVGGDGTDTVRYWNSDAGITIDLENQTVTGGEATGDTISGFENVTASAHDDTIVGSSGDNTLYAQQGDDLITGAGGNDVIYGASGTDTAIYTGTWADYTITESGGTFTIVDNRPGSPDGTDTVSYVEFFQFSDGTFAAADILNDTPTDISHTGGSVNENSAGGTVVATLSSTDADSGIPSETETYSITNDPSGNFEIVGNEVRVKAGASLDHESDATHDITVQVTDVHGATYSEVITVNVADINETPTDIEFGLNTGIGLNTDGGNNAYLYASNGGDIVGGLSEMTIEVEFASSHAAGTDMPLFSYHVGGASDEIELGINDTGSSLELYIEIGEQAVSVSGYDAQQLLDGSDHHVSLTWDNTAGDWEIFVDGASVASGTGIATGHTIATGGAIVLGQEQDSLNGGYNNEQVFDGTYYDVRIFDDVRTSTEIANNAFEEVSSSEPGLVANWQMNDLSGGVTTDTVSGNNLTVSNVTGTGWTTSTPSLTSTIFEDNAAGTVAAVLSTTDPDSGDSFSYAITNDPSGNFEIVGNEIRVKAGASLDHETNASHDVTVQVTDSGGLTYQETVTINVADVNEAPTDITFTGNEDVAIGAAIGTTVATAAGVDQDAGETFTYALTNDANGAFTIDATTGAIKIASGGLGLDLTQQTGSDNPFNGIDVGSYSAPVLVDLDGDGDLDIMIGNGGSYGGDSEYYENTGTATNPTYSFHSENPFGLIDIGSESTPSFVDIDGDGDLDMFIGESDGTINYFENTGNSTSPAFTQRTGASNPFNGETVGTYSAPTFVDIDNDGDMDAVIGGGNGLLDYYINNGTDQAPSFTEVSDATFGITGGWNDVGSEASPTFVDADGDGDMDMFVGEADGILNYYENTGTAANASFSNTPSANPFGIVDVGSESMPTFADVDGDGDMDLIVGESDGTINYFENTASLIDGSSTSSHDITVQVTDSGGLITTEDVTLQFGTNATETLSGDADTDIIYGFGGNDTLSGAGGDDVIYGGAGADDLDGDAGNDTLVGGVGADNLDGGTGDDTLFGDSEDGDTRLVLNQSGTDDLASVSNISDFPTTALTFEMRFAIDDVPSGAVVLASYTVSSTYDEEFALTAAPSGNLFVNIHETDYLGGQDTGISLASLSDGQEHMLSVSWDSATGSLSVYVDGEAQYTGTYQQGVSITQGGTLAFGQDQDTVGGGFDSSEIFSGTIDEVRIFDDVRTAQEIADNAESQIPNPSSEQGLVSNWQFDTESTSTVTDLAGSNDLTLSNGAAVGTPAGNYDDTLTGGDGNDMLIGGVGADSLDGGIGTDTADYSTSSAAVSVNLGTGAGTGGDAQGDTLTNIENVTGSDYNDTLTGDSGANTLTGGDGNDTLYGGDGSDLFVFWEGDGADSVYGGQGASWTDTIELHDSSGGANLGTYGVDWTVNLTEGSITSQDSDSLTLSDDADGTITLQDGSSINFYDIERVEF